MIEFENFRLQLKLEAQSPLLHFQSAQNGATLRASEAKPKLDKLLLKKMKQDAASGKWEQEWGFPLKKGDRRVYTDPDHEALNYKMSIYTDKKDVVLINEREMKNQDKFQIFYGNSGRDVPIRGVYSNPVVEITCFSPVLRKYISEYIEDFFLVTNFGTMQHKGFGSFLPVTCGYGRKLKPDEEKQVADVLKRETDAKTCYHMVFKECIGNIQKNAVTGYTTYHQEMFNSIRFFYSTMKSGQNIKNQDQYYIRSYIYQYMHKKGIGNEKAWMKERNISPNIGEHKPFKTPGGQEAKYVRALLGIGSQLSYLTNKLNAQGKPIRENISIDHRTPNGENKLERVPSPIFFKIIKNEVFILAKAVPKEVYNQKFNFYNKGKDVRKGGDLYTPEKSEFDIADFMDSYVKYYNSDKVKPFKMQKVGVTEIK